MICRECRCPMRLQEYGNFHNLDDPWWAEWVHIQCDHECVCEEAIEEAKG